jgi:hypothetical protein
MKLYKLKFKFNPFKSENLISCEMINMTDLEPTYVFDVLNFGFYVEPFKRDINLSDIVNRIEMIFINVEYNLPNENYISLWLKCVSDYNRNQKLNELDENL